MSKTALLISVTALALLLFAGAALAATVRCDGGPCRGTNQADRITGSPKADKIKALGANDRVDAGRLGDVVYGGNGADTINGSYGKDRMYGGAGNDPMSGGPAQDRIFAGPGVDNVFGNTGSDYIVIAGDAANDFVDCGTGNNDVVVIDRREMEPPNLADFVAQTSCEDVRIAPPR